MNVMREEIEVQKRKVEEQKLCAQRDALLAEAEGGGGEEEERRSSCGRTSIVDRAGTWAGSSIRHATRVSVTVSTGLTEAETEAETLATCLIGLSAQVLAQSTVLVLSQLLLLSSPHRSPSLPRRAARASGRSTSAPPPTFSGGLIRSNVQRVTSIGSHIVLICQCPTSRIAIQHVTPEIYDRSYVSCS